MTQWVKVLATTPLITWVCSPGLTCWKERTDSHMLSSDLHSCAMVYMHNTSVNSRGFQHEWRDGSVKCLCKHEDQNSTTSTHINLTKKKKKNKRWWCILVIPVLGRHLLIHTELCLSLLSTLWEARSLVVCCCIPGTVDLSSSRVSRLCFLSCSKSTEITNAN